MGCKIRHFVKSQPRKNWWKPEEDLVLKSYVETHGEGNWASVSKNSGLKRGGKSCRLRWKNYLRPDIKRGEMSKEEEDLIVRMHKLLGNRWSLIAGRLPGRTDNEVKNYWNTHLNKRSQRQKRKITDSSDQYGKINGKKIRSCDSEIIDHTTGIAETVSKVSGKEQEELGTGNNMENLYSWVDETESFNYDHMNYYSTTVPAAGNDAALIFDDIDEPFITLWDSFDCLG